MQRIAPGAIRDSIVGYLKLVDVASVAEISGAVTDKLGDVSASSVRSYLNLNVPDLFERVERGKYRLKNGHANGQSTLFDFTERKIGKATLVRGDCFDWLKTRASSSIHAVVTDPPYGLVEYTEIEKTKLRKGKGGVWRIPPEFDGSKRSPLPRFTVLREHDRRVMRDFFAEFATALLRVTVPGANVVVASNPLLSHVVADAMTAGGLEMRGQIVRLVMTMRGGDRPKNAHDEFADVSVMPRSMFEPWIVLRHPLDGRAQDNLRKWKTGGFRRVSDERPFGDVIRSHPTMAAERKLAPHPSLKPQSFMRQIVRASLPLGKGTILDPFAGAGSTCAAANAVGYTSIGIERDAEYFKVACKSVPKLAELKLVDPVRA